MRAWVCRNYNYPFDVKFEQIEPREPNSDEVQVAVRAAGVNFAETLMMMGKYQVKCPLPFIVGFEGSGVVMKCGSDVIGFKPGDEVIMIDSDFENELHGGTFAEVTTINQKWLFHKPTNISFAEAASFPSSFGTAYNALCRRDQIKPGEVLVVHGAGGGAGLAAVQLGSLLGAIVIGTAGSAEKLKVVKEMGAHHVINYNAELVRPTVLEITQGRGADVYFDPVGGELFDSSMRAIAPGGRILVVGFTSGKHLKAPTNDVLCKMISIIGVEARLFQRIYPELHRADIEKILDFIQQGRLRPYYSKAFDMTQLKEAFEYLGSRTLIGKCVLVNNQGGL